MRRRLLLPLAVVVAASCKGGGEVEDRAKKAVAGSEAMPAEITLESPEAKVVVRTSPFGYRVESKGAKGPRVMLDTAPRLSGGAALAGDAAGAYGPLGADHRAVEIKSAIIEGWDHTGGTDGPFFQGTRVVSADTQGAKTSLELDDPDHPGSRFHVEISVEGAEVRFEAGYTGEAPPSPPDIEVDDGAPGANQVTQAFQLGDDERFFALGERFVSTQHRGQRYECWAEEGGVGGGEKAKPGPHNPSPNGASMTHLPVPFLLSSRGYGLWVETSYRTGFALGSDDPRYFRVYAHEPRLKYRVLVHDEAGKSLEHFTELTGRAALPAPWVFGPRRRVDQGSMIDGEPELSALRSHKVPTTMVDDATHFLPIASEAGREKELGDWCAEAHRLGYKAIGYYNAYVSTENPKAKDILDAGRAGDFFVKLDDGREFDTFMISAGGQIVATIDFTAPGASEWYGTLLDRALGLGYDGWMLDFGEYLPPKARLRDGRTGFEAHNAYPVLYQQATFEHMRKVRGDDFMYFARSGYTGTQSFTPVVWSGDPSASFDDVKGLPANVRAGISAGMSGIPFWGSDISGYTCLNDPPADKEVYLRWAEVGAFSSDMHDENACSQAPKGSPPKWTLWSDAETTQVYGTYARWHTRLFPYLYAAAVEATKTGMPVVRHPLLMGASSPEAAEVELEYYFGPSLYVAPVVRRGETSRTFWLPEGEWLDFWTNERVSGGKQVTRDAPLSVVPVLQRVGTLVPLLDEKVETLAPDQSDQVTSLGEVTGVLDVRAFVGPGGLAASMTLADGTRLSASLAEGGQPVLPSGITQAQTEAELATCDGCGRVDSLEGGVTRVRVSASAKASGSLSLAADGAPSPLRVRWDVYVAN